MQRIAVGETISSAYHFGFARFFTVLGIAWFPRLLALAAVAAGYFAVAPDLPHQILSGHVDPAVFSDFHRSMGAVWLIALFTQSIVTVGLQKKALGRMEGPTFFYFSLSAPVWRMLGATLLAFIALVILMIATAIVAGIASFLAIHFVADYGKALAAVFVLAGVLWMIYASVRLLFFLPAVVVAEEEFGLVRAWELGAGNFWRIVIVVAAIFLPLAIVLGIADLSLLWPLLREFLQQLHPGMKPAQIEQLDQQFIATFFTRMGPELVVLELISFVGGVISLGLGNGAVARAYLDVTGGAAS